MIEKRSCTLLYARQDNFVDCYEVRNIYTCPPTHRLFRTLSKVRICTVLFLFFSFFSLRWRHRCLVALNLTPLRAFCSKRMIIIVPYQWSTTRHRVHSATRWSTSLSVGWSVCRRFDFTWAPLINTFARLYRWNLVG